MMKIKLLTKIAATAILVCAMAGTGAALASGDDVLYINGAEIVLNSSALTVGGRMYAPVRELSEKMGWQIKTAPSSDLISVSNALGDTLSFKTSGQSFTFNGKAYAMKETARIKNGAAYFPLRILAEFMHASVKWNKETNKPAIQNQSLRAALEGESLSSIARENQTTADLLKKVNGLSSDSLQIGQKLKIVVPELIKNEAAPKISIAVGKTKTLNQDEVGLLAKLVEAEAGGEPYDGKLAVANVVMNRAASGEYAKTVKDVIYEPNQFTPAGNGKLEQMIPCDDSVKAAKAALSGENNVPDAVFFFNPKLEAYKLAKVQVVAKIGSHVFGK